MVWEVPDGSLRRATDIQAWTDPVGVMVWLVAGPVMVGLAIMMQWWALLVIVPAVLATRNYLLEGGMFEAVDGMSRDGGWIAKRHT